MINEYLQMVDTNKELVMLRKENADLKLLLEGANKTCDEIAKIVGDRGQYRDLVEAVEMKIHFLKSRPTYEN